MFNHRNQIRFRHLITWGLLPAFVLLVLMAVVYAGVGMIIVSEQTLAKTNVLFGISALISILVIPHFIIGLVVGYQRGFTVVSPVAMGLAPLFLFIFSLAIFGGPLFAPIESIGITIVMIFSWILISTTGMVAGSKLPQFVEAFK